MRKNVLNFHKPRRYRIIKMQWQRISVSSNHSYNMNKWKAQPKARIISILQHTVPILLPGAEFAGSKGRIFAFVYLTSISMLMTGLSVIVPMSK